MKWTLNQIIGTILVAVGVVLGFLEFLIKSGIIKLSDTLKPTGSNIFDFLIELVKQGNAPYAVCIVFIGLGIYLLTHPGTKPVAHQKSPSHQ